MGEFAKYIFSALPHVVGDTRSLIAYAIACTVWLTIALKVIRNKNLLMHLEKLPAGDRLHALRLEMGSIPVPDGLSPADYLKARQHSYYFWALIVLAALIASLIGLAFSYRHPLTPEVIAHGVDAALTRQSLRQADEARSTKIDEQKKAIENLQPSRTVDYYISQFGPPDRRIRSGASMELTWLKSDFGLAVEFSEDMSIGYSFTSYSPNFQPLVPFTRQYVDQDERDLMGRSTGRKLPSVKIGGPRLDELSDALMFSEHMDVGGSEIAQFGALGSMADNLMHGYVGCDDYGARFPLRAKTDAYRLFPGRYEGFIGDVSNKVEGTGNCIVNSFALYEFPLERERSCSLKEAAAREKKEDRYQTNETAKEEVQRCSFTSQWSVSPR